MHTEYPECVPSEEEQLELSKNYTLWLDGKQITPKRTKTRKKTTAPN